MCCSFKCFFIVTVLIAVIIPNLVFYYGKDSKRAAGSIPFITPKETWGFTFEEMPDQTGRIIIITGANSLEQIIDCYEFISALFGGFPEIKTFGNRLSELLQNLSFNESIRFHGNDFTSR